MGKHGVIGIGFKDIIRPIPFKKNLLLFDKLVVVEETLGIARQLVSLVSKEKNFDFTNYVFNNQTIDFLGNEGLLDIVTIRNRIILDVKNYEGKSSEELDEVAKEIHKINLEANKLHDGIKLVVAKQKLSEMIPDLITTFPSYFLRYLSLKLNFEGVEAYPLFTNDFSYDNMGKKEAVLRFILNQLPEPDDSVSFDQILEFRKDPDTLAKYYALIKWVNEVAKKDFNIHEIQDEYNYLYNEYKRHFKIHSIKSKQGIIEIFVTGAIDVLSGQLSVGGVSTSLFSLGKHNLNLLEAELKFTGREIAYIHKTEEKFKK